MADIPLDRILQQWGVLDENLNPPKTEKEAIVLLEKAHNNAKKNWFSQNFIRSYIDMHDLAKQIWERIPYFYDKSKMWWLWNDEKYVWEVVDETDILLFVKKLCAASTTKSYERNQIIEGMRQYGREKIPKPIKKTWIQFKDTIVDYKTGEEIEAKPEYFVTNSIPWPLHKERFVDTPVIDRIFEEWVGEDYVKTLYEIIAYCLVPDYPIHRLFCFIGEGLNGKSCFLRLLKKFIGEENVTSTELDTLLTSRFEITKLHKKLVCMMGETNFAEMEKTSVLKKLTGQDTIGFEYKNKNPFDDFNYAKILLATNNLPTTTDKTLGFYRRWLIIDFPNKFSEKKDILDDIPEEEYEILTVKSLIVLKDLMKKKEFHKEGSLEEREKRYEEKSNPFDKFWKEVIVEDPNSNVSKKKFREKLESWCKENRFRLLSDHTIAKHMKDKGVETTRLTMDWIDTGYGKEKPRYWAWEGIKLRGEDEELSKVS
jgi:P4 family phage/plasmid primase-like protien